MTDRNNEPDNQERQEISIKLMDRMFTLPESVLISIINKRIVEKLNKVPESVLNSIINKKIMEKLNKGENKVVKPLRPDLKLKIAKIKSKIKGCEVQVKVFQHLIGQLKKDLELDENAQPRRYAPLSIYQKIRSNKIEKEQPKKTLLITLSDDEVDNEAPMTSLGSNAIQLNIDESSTELSCVLISDDENETK